MREGEMEREGENRRFSNTGEKQRLDYRRDERGVEIEEERFRVKKRKSNAQQKEERKRR